MKKLVLTFAFLLTLTVAFAQQLPIRIVNNTTQTITINLINFYGDNPVSPPNCSSCGHVLFSSPFDILSSSAVLIEEYEDFDTLDGGLPVPLWGWPGTCNPCAGWQADVLCDFTVPNAIPVWTHLSFTHPNFTQRIGDPSCGYSNFETGGGITASWQYPVNGEVLVIFN